jgi:hypothetical protein
MMLVEGGKGNHSFQTCVASSRGPRLSRFGRIDWLAHRQFPVSSFWKAVLPTSSPFDLIRKSARARVSNVEAAVVSLGRAMPVVDSFYSPW